MKRRDFARSRFGMVRKRSDFDSSGSVKRKRVYGSVCDQSEPSSWAGWFRFNMAGHILTVQSNQFCAVRKLNVQSELQNCVVQNMCFELSHKSTTRVILSSAASASVSGGSWQLVYPTSGKGVP